MQVNGQWSQQSYWLVQCITTGYGRADRENAEPWSTI